MNTRQFLRDCREWLKRGAYKLHQGFKGELLKVPDACYLFDFKTPDTIKNFVCITDAQVGGNSTANLSTSRNGRLLFAGNVCTSVEASMPIDHTGFCGIRSNPKVGLFNKVELMDLGYYDCVEIKYRGDGRPYFVNIQTNSIMMMNPYDLFQAFMFTKGGPYWEIERFPFSKFFQTYQGYLQDTQFEFNNVRTIGISISDRKPGPFQLEIEYLKLIKIRHQPQTFRTVKSSRYQSH